MATVEINGPVVGTALQELLCSDDIVQGSAPSYQICKTIYSYHPIGSKLVDAPIELAQSQARRISVAKGPEDRIRDAFLKEWEALGADKLIANTKRLSRIYGIASVALLTDGEAPSQPVNYQQLFEKTIAFNVLDPLNTSGSLVLNQDPNSMDFQKHAAISVSGKPYHRNRSCTVMNEEPLYIEFTSSAFGFVGRSVYQRTLLPLKSFIATMITDDMVSKKAGLLMAFIKQAGAIVDGLMAMATGIKRSLLKYAVVDNVLSLGVDDRVESLNLQNLDGAFGNSRKNILKNIATGAGMPAVLIENETLTEGFGEGTEDAKTIARFVDRFRAEMNPLYAWFDLIVQHRAWNPNFFKAMQREFPEEYGSREFNEVFFEWKESFTAIWPNLLEEPDSEKIKVEDVKFKALIAFLEVVVPMVDPENKTAMIQWAVDNMNVNKLLFPTPLEIDPEALLEWVPPTAVEEPGEPKPFAAQDAYSEAVKRLPVRKAIGRRAA